MPEPGRLITPQNAIEEAAPKIKCICDFMKRYFPKTYEEERKAREEKAREKIVIHY